MMKDIMSKLANLEATAPKITKKKMLNEDSTTPPMNVSDKPASLKDIFETMAMQKPIPVVGKQGDTQQTGAGFLNVTDTSPAAQALGNALGDLVTQKKVQIVMPNQGQPAPAGATGQPQAGQVQMKEKITKKTPAGEIISDFEKSKNPKFKGKSKEERKKMALGAYYGMHPEKSKKKTDEGDIPSTQGIDNNSPLSGSARSMTTLEGIMSDMSNGTKVLGNHHGFLIFLPSGHVVQPTKRPPFGQSTIGFGPDPIDDKEEWEKLPWNILEVGDPDEKDAWWDYGQKTLRMKPVDYSSLPRDLQTRATRLYQKYSSGQGPNAFAGRSFEKFNKGKTMKNFAEGKWNYPEHMKKTVTTSDMGTTNAQDNRDARREFRKKEKAKAHAELMKGGKKVNEANEAETHFAILDPKLIDQISQMSGAAVEPDTNPPTVSSYDGNTVRQLLAFAQKYPDRLKKTQVLHRGLAQPAMAQPVGGFDKMGGPEYNLKEGKKKAKPDFLDMDKDGNKKESMKKAAADKKKKKVDESINHRISAARLEGKSHGLRGHAYHGKAYDDIEEMKAYHDGFKEGLDECYGMGVYETAPATVPGMADAAMDEGNAFTDALARTPKGGKFSVGGKTFTDNSSLEEAESGFQLFIPSVSGAGKEMSQGDDSLLNQHVIAGDIKRVYSSDPKKRFGMTYAATNPKGEEILQYLHKKGIGKGPGIMSKIKSAVGLGETDFAFEAWDRELSNLLNESEKLSEGLSVSVSKGQQNSPDSVTITAQDAEADQLLQLVKHAGLGLFGDDHAEPSSAMSVQPDHGAPDEVGAGGVDVEVVDGHDGIMGLMQKLSGIQADGASDEDYADEEGGEEKHTCNECGMMEAECGCGDKEMVDEVESEDQQEFEVAEDNAPDSGEKESTADEDAEAKEDAALAGADSGDEEEMNEGFTFESLLKRMDSLVESKEEDEEEEDEESEELDEGKWNYPKHMTKTVTTSDMDTTNAARNREERKAFRKKEKAKAHAALMKGEPKKEKDEDLTEWANQAGKGPGKGTDASFEQDIDFMTKVIAGGLNKPKSTGQTTVPVIAGQEDRMHDNPSDWATLAGIKK